MRNKKKTGTFKRLVTMAVALALLAGIGTGLFLLFKDRTAPEIIAMPSSGHVSLTTEFTVTARDQTSGVKKLVVMLVQGNKTATVVDETPQGSPTATSSTFKIKPKSLKNGNFEILIRATDDSLYHFGAGSVSEMRLPFTLDTKAPRITVSSLTHNLNQGGCGAVAYTLDEEPVETGVMVGDQLFPAYKQPSGEYVCLFAQPYNVPPSEFNPMIVATDIAGNQRKAGFQFHSNKKKFRHDDIRISDSFLNRKMPQFSERFPDETPLNTFLKVNRELRVKNRARLREIGLQTAPVPLWKGVFKRMLGATMATFGDNRTYVSGGQKIDTQTHLGIDIASTRHARVPAANDGNVVFTGFYGIYGNTVIVDHGMGLQTLYAHLSKINVDQGQSVQRGQVVGLTGATGLAGGDHLHFGVILSGQPVQPLEWWDGRWIKNNIDPKFEK